MAIDWETHKERLKKALDNFLGKDMELLQRDVNERSISFKIGSYLAIEYEGERDVDCEYNRKGDDVKRLPLPVGIKSDDTNGKTIFPDIIVHTRGQDECNELIIEIKKKNNSDTQRDFEKLTNLTKQDGGYNYKYGIHITFSEDKICDIEVYEDGSKQDERTKELQGFLGAP